MAKSNIRALLVLACAVGLPPVVLADEVVHFTNGAEMAVRSHTVERDMVKLDLGNNSFIAFPMAMVDKIVNAGQDVFLNPTIHPANQAVAGSGAVDSTNRGSGAPIGGAPPPGVKGAAGVMLGEAADIQQQATHGNPDLAQADVNRRRIFNPSFPNPPGSMPQVIMPPTAKAPRGMTLVAPRAQPAPSPQPTGGTNDPTPPQGTPTPDDPPDTP